MVNELTFEKRDTIDEGFGVRVDGRLEGTLEYHDGCHQHLGGEQAGWFFYPLYQNGVAASRTRLCGDDWGHAMEVVRLLVRAYLHGAGRL